MPYRLFKNLCTALFFLLLLSGCTIFGKEKKPEKLELRYNAGAFINYGYSFELDAYVIYSNGKEKEVTGKDELSIEIYGATYYDGWVRIDAYPKAFSQDIIKITAKYIKDEVSLVDTEDIPFNYKGDLVVSFTGRQGAGGIDGAKGGSSLLSRDGKEGDPGQAGSRGGDGDNLTVYIWKDASGLYKMKVTNLVTGSIYYYNSSDAVSQIKFDVSGGQGGTGGDGGDGGNGKDGTTTDKKTKVPGNGGAGATGGIGGPGGNGGNVYVFVHPNAAAIQSKLSGYLNAGYGGNGGNGGDGGKAGTPLEGQAAAAAGSEGAKGLQGISGLPGAVFQVLIEEFDIEN